MKKLERKAAPYSWSSRLLAILFHTGSGLERRSDRGRIPWCSELERRRTETSRLAHSMSSIAKTCMMQKHNSTERMELQPLQINTE